MMVNKKVHPYIPNSEDGIKNEMLKELGVGSVEEIYRAAIPEHLLFKGKMDLPAPILSEARLQRHVEELLRKNKNCKDNLNFLGAGCYQHHVPAVCDTILSRDEFLTAYVGEAYSDHGKFQALFETASMIGELTGFDACNTPVYDWGNAAAVAGRMACRTKGKKRVLVSEAISPRRMMIIAHYLKPDIELVTVRYNYEKAFMDTADLKDKLTGDTAAVYFENPTYFGSIETSAAEIADLVHENDSFVIVGVDPISLGVLEAPAHYGADYAVGDYQSLGLHMSFGGSLGGWVATRDEERMVAEYPSLLFGMTETVKEGEYGFGEVAFDRTSYGSREKGKDFVGTAAALHGIVAGVYMALMGPRGFEELGEGIMQRVAYAKKRIAEIEGVKIALPKAYTFKEFIVNFDDTGKTVCSINESLRDYGIFGGNDLSNEFPVLGQSALYCITEMMTQDDIEKLVESLTKICMVRGR